MTTEVSAILVICDRLVGEIGRRDHMFGWLRAPASNGTQWVAVDSYYPSNRLVVLRGGRASEETHLCSELIPAHGLRLLWIEPSELPDDAAGLSAVLERRIAELGPAQRSSGQLPMRERPIARAVSLMPQPATQPVVRRRMGESRAAATARGARFVASRHGATAAQPRSRTPPSGGDSASEALPVSYEAEPQDQAYVGSELATPPAEGGEDRSPVSDTSNVAGQPAPVAAHGAWPREPGPLLPVRRAPPRGVRRAPATPGSRQRVPAHVRSRRTVERQPLPAPGLLVGLALIVILCLEMFLGVADLALSAGHVLLAFGIALDACSRALGTIAAQRAHRPNWVWGCAIIGSPAVLAFALYGSDEQAAAEPAPLAGLLSLLACGAIALYLLARLLNL